MRLRRLRKRVAAAVLALRLLGCLSCGAMVLVVSADVLLRKLTGARLSVAGSGELSAYLLVVVCMLSIPAYQVGNGHIAVEFLAQKLPPGPRRILRAAVLFAECAVCALLTYAAGRKTLMFLETGTASDILNLPKWPFALVVLLGFLEMTILLGLDACLTLEPDPDEIERKKR